MRSSVAQMIEADHQLYILRLSPQHLASSRYHSESIILDTLWDMDRCRFRKAYHGRKRIF